MSSLAGLLYLQHFPQLAAWLGAGMLLAAGCLVAVHQHARRAGASTPTDSESARSATAGHADPAAFLPPDESPAER